MQDIAEIWKYKRLIDQEMDQIDFGKYVLRVEFDACAFGQGPEPASKRKWTYLQETLKKNSEVILGDVLDCMLVVDDPYIDVPFENFTNKSKARIESRMYPEKYENLKKMGDLAINLQVLKIAWDFANARFPVPGVAALNWNSLFKGEGKQMLAFWKEVNDLDDYDSGGRRRRDDLPMTQPSLSIWTPAVE